MKTAKPCIAQIYRSVLGLKTGTIVTNWIKELLSEARGEVSETEGEVSEVEGEVSEAKGEVSETEEEVSEVKGVLSEAKGEVSETKGEVSEAKGEVSEATAKLSEIRKLNRKNHFGMKKKNWLRSLVVSFRKKKKSKVFTKNVLAGRGFKIGDFTYGKPIVFHWGEPVTLEIGKFCSFADQVTIFLGGNHRIDWVTTYPFNAFHNYRKRCMDRLWSVYYVGSKNW